MPTYHGIVRAKCLTCGYESRDTTELEMWNDYGVACIRCPGGPKTEWELEDGSITIFQNDEDDDLQLQESGTDMTSTTTDFTVIHDTGYGPVGQRDTGRTVIREDAATAIRVRVTVHCNFYDFQSYTKAEAWTTNNGWRTVIYWDGKERSLPKGNVVNQRPGDEPLVNTRVEEAFDVAWKVVLS